MSVPDTRTESAAALHQQIRVIVEQIAAADQAESEHRSQVLAWLDRTADIFRRVKPRTPSPHLVSYFVPVDHETGRVLLASHRAAGLWLPPGGHVEPGEHPADTVRRESREELGIEARFSPLTGCRPLFVTVTETVPSAAAHVDVSLWYVLSCAVGEPLTPDEREFSGIRWWTRTAIAKAAPALFDPHLGRMLAKLDQAARPGGRRDRYREEKR